MMADPKHVERLKLGREAWNAGRQKEPSIRPDLSRAELHAAHVFGANLTDADLFGANLTEANLTAADLTNANLTDVDLTDANLNWADLRAGYLTGANLTNANLCRVNLFDANLTNANLTGADLTNTNLTEANLTAADLIGANLSGADLTKVNLQRANLIDTLLDRANLTDARLWETQRGGWSIKGVICQRAFWDRDGKEPAKYAEGEFERVFAEKPRIVLRYKGKMSPIDIIALPIIVERIQAEHPDSALQIHSVQNDAGGASVTITVEDLIDRGTKVFSAELETIRAELTTTQSRLQNEEKLRISFQTQCEVLVERIIPTLAAVPKQQVNIGRLTAPMTIEGMNKDTYNVSGVGALTVGPHAHAHDMTFQQIQGGINLPKLAEELDQLKRAVESQHGGTATLVQSAPVNDETFNGQTVWQGLVHIFNLTGHPTATRAYAWSSPIEGSTKRRFYAVLHTGSITGPVEAVRARP